MTDSGSRFGQRLALVVTNLIKVAGLILAIKAAFSKTQPPALEFALAAFMMAGAQLSEQAIMALLGKLFAPATPPDAPTPPHQASEEAKK